MITQIIAIAILASSFVKALGGPDCALKCLGMESRTCGETDSACRCRDREFGAVKLCLVSACPEDQIHAAIQTTKEFCSNAGVELSFQCGFHCYAKDSRKCSKYDYACRCHDSELADSITQCIIASCPTDLGESNIQDVQRFCSGVGAPLSLGSGPSTVSGSATHMTQNTPVTSSLSTTPAEISPTQITKDAASQNANDAAPRNLNVVAGLIAFGLVALAV
ncbi:hypothetical protein AB1N83_011770 [Pleurotus pulmonarius]